MATAFARFHVTAWLALLAAQAAGAQLVAPQNAAKMPDAAPFLAEKKVAIVVGISDYPAESGFPKLQFAAKDASDMAAALVKEGYQVQLLTDQHAMRSSIRKALEQAQVNLNQGASGASGGTILFAFSGHGGETAAAGGTPRQYLVTYDATAEDPEPGYPLKDIVTALQNSGATHRMMFLDACRDETGAASKGAPALTSFHQLMSAQGMKILFSTAPGQQSYEDAKDQNGYFTHYLLQGLAGKAATPDGLITFDGLAKWVSQSMRSDEGVYQTPYWNQNASGDFYLAGGLVRKEALVIGVDRYPGHSLNSAIGGAKQVNAQLNLAVFNTTYLENPSIADIEAKLIAFGSDMSPRDVALVYFAGSGGIATGMPFLMAADANLPDHATDGRWEKAPAGAVTVAEVMDTVGRNHPGPNLYLLDVGLARASSAEKFNLALLKRDHSLVMLCCRPGQEPARTANGSLFSQVFVSVLKQPNLSAGYAASKIMSAVFEQTNGEEYAIEVPMLPDRVYLTPSR